MKKQKTPKITPLLLRILQNGIYATGDLFDIFLSGYGESYRKMHQLTYRGNSLGDGKKDWGDIYIEAQQFYSALYYLKQKGFIKKNESKGRKFIKWKITKKGKEKLRIGEIREKEKNMPEDSIFRVIIFDIPENKRKKRGWLRETLRRMGFSLLQESVWIGKRKIPEEFLFDLKDQKIFKYVHIFEVREEGTIQV